MLDTILLIVLLIVSAIILIVVLLSAYIKKKNDDYSKLEKMIGDLNTSYDKLGESFNVRFDMVRDQLHRDTMQTEQKLENMRNTIAESISRMQQSNTIQLDSIRKTVDEKLQDTLDKKLNDSFKIVSERLEQVYKGLGEMQTLASGVGDLKKVLSNVKTRGVLGEVQLGAILEQILSPEQYDKNVKTKKGSRDLVEYAIKLPGDSGSPVWLPIDAKFPMDAYQQVLDAYDTTDAAIVESALKLLKNRVRTFAKDINTKYIDPPHTTDFAIMFLPIEGLYAELVRMGMIEELQNDFRICLTGPTTMGALLNSLQMGFRTLAIQKRSNEVWKVLSAVKTEFDTFADVLTKTQEKIDQANKELDKLVGVRTRQIQKKLGDVQVLPISEAERLIMSDYNNV